jgi:hypothetical protein
MKSKWAYEFTAMFGKTPGGWIANPRCGAGSRSLWPTNDTTLASKTNGAEWIAVKRVRAYVFPDGSLHYYDPDSKT